MVAFRVLVVCLGNVCRSPYAERLLASALPADRFAFSSAGLLATPGATMSAETQRLVLAAGGEVDGFASRSLAPALLEEADLVLTATTAISARLAKQAPGFERRTFTMLELAALIEHLQLAGNPRHVVFAAAARRASVKTDELDVPDPYGRDDAAYAHAALLMDQAIATIVKALQQ